MQEYAKLANESQLLKNDLVYSSSLFSSFNADKCEYLGVFYTPKISLITGVRNKEVLVPFSAPFGFIRYASTDLKYSTIEDFYRKTIEWYESDSRLDRRKITLPPYFYDQSMIRKNSLALANAGFELCYRDINSHIEVAEFEVGELPASARNKIKKSQKNNNEFYKAVTLDEQKACYQIIKSNRMMKGYPLRMSELQVLNTAKIVKADFFITKIDGKYAAAAIIFRVNSSAVQVIYWGANEYGEKHGSMYYLPLEIISYYKKMGIKYIDVGTSSEAGDINSGLNDYKQSIGCVNTIKETWEYQ
jgi:hypothetical protein